MRPSVLAPPGSLRECPTRPHTGRRDQGRASGQINIAVHNLVTDHCVTGIAGRKAVNPPRASA
jgi:hypothetical protein